MTLVCVHVGVPVKTVVAQHVLDAAYMGNFKALPLQFGDKHSDKVHLCSCHSACSTGCLRTSEHTSLLAALQCSSNPGMGRQVLS